MQDKDREVESFWGSIEKENLLSSRNRWVEMAKVPNLILSVPKLQCQLKNTILLKFIC